MAVLFSRGRVSTGGGGLLRGTPGSPASRLLFVFPPSSRPRLVWPGRGLRRGRAQDVAACPWPEVVCPSVPGRVCVRSLRVLLQTFGRVACGRASGLRESLLGCLENRRSLSMLDVEPNTFSAFCVGVNILWVSQDFSASPLFSNVVT